MLPKLMALMIFLFVNISYQQTKWPAGSYILTQNALKDAPERYQHFLEELIEYLEKYPYPDVN